MKKKIRHFVVNNNLNYLHIHDIQIANAACQIIVSVSVLYIWVFRYDNIILEFKHYGYSDLLRNAVGASKISISAIMIMGIWFNEVVVYASLSMAFFMLCAQASHLKVKNPIVKFIPSFVFLLMSLFVAAFNYGLL